MEKQISNWIEDRSNYPRDQEAKIVYDLPRNSNPPCVWDGNPTQRTGGCYTCLACGSTTSCG
jgi:hypothetical protein